MLPHQITSESKNVWLALLLTRFLTAGKNRNYWTTLQRQLGMTAPS